MGDTKTVDLPIAETFNIVEEFVRSRGASIDDYNPPFHLRAGMGSIFSFSKDNAKKDLIFALEQVPNNKTTVRLDLSFLKDNISIVIQFIIILFISAVILLFPFVGVILVGLMLIPTLIYLAYWFIGRGKIENEFWEYFNYKVAVLQRTMQQHPANSQPSGGTYTYARSVFPQDESLCAICHLDLLRNETALQCAKCSSLFHDGCFTSWIELNRFCPICNTAIMR